MMLKDNNKLIINDNIIKNSKNYRQDNNDVFMNSNNISVPKIIKQLISIKQHSFEAYLNQTMQKEQIIEIPEDAPKDLHNTKRQKNEKAKPTNQKVSRRTRRKKQSDEQFAIPTIIPLSQSQQLLIYQSFDLKVTTCIIQIPFPLFHKGNFSQIVTSRVESSMIEIQIQKNESENIVVSIKIKNISNGNHSHQKQEVIHIQSSQKEDQINLGYEFWGKLCWYGSHQIQSKIIKKCRKNVNEHEFNEVAVMKTKQVNSDLFLVLNIQRQQIISKDYLGLINQGNTCYMNSYLQMLYHIVQFRNLVFEAKIEDQTKFPATLQDLFYRLQNDQRAVSAEQLVRSFGWTKKQVLVQQDAQQFSCIFFQKLEQKLNETIHKSNHFNMNQLFEGQLIH